MKQEHVQVITSPPQGLAVGGELQAGETIDRTGGPVFARDPLGINQFQIARLNGNIQACVQDFAGRVGEIHSDCDGPMRLRRRRDWSCQY